MASNVWETMSNAGAKAANSAKITTEDKRLTEVKNDEKAALSENEKTYNGMINSADKYYNDQIKASEDWEKKQTKLQQDRTDFTIDKIEQEKAQSQKDYIKEQSGAYVDWQKQSNQYGTNAEQMAASGLANSGFSESSQVSMYNAYQNRVAVAREANVIAMQNFDNAITEAQLQNSSALAEIAYKAQQEQLTLNMQRFQYRNTLLLEMMKSKREIDQMYHNRYQNVLSQINQEKALAEQIRQFNEKMAFEREQFNWEKAKAAKSAGVGRGATSGSVRGTSKVASVGSGTAAAAKAGAETAKNNAAAREKEEKENVAMKSLTKAGFAGRSAATVDKAVQAGILKETTDKNGNVVFKRTDMNSVTVASKNPLIKMYNSVLLKGLEKQ